MTAEQKQFFLKLAEGYKEQVYGKLLELLPGRILRIDKSQIRSMSMEEVMQYMYIQGVAEALDSYDVGELLRAFSEADQAQRS